MGSSLFRFAPVIYRSYFRLSYVSHAICEFRWRKLIVVLLIFALLKCYFFGMQEKNRIFVGGYAQLFPIPKRLIN